MQEGPARASNGDVAAQEGSILADGDVAGSAVSGQEGPVDGGSGDGEQEIGDYD